MDTPHILTCLSGSPCNRQVVRFAASLAQGLGGALTALDVEPSPGGLPKGESAQRLQDNTRLAEALGAHVATVYGGDVMTQVAEYARLSGVSHIVLGQADHFTLFRNTPQNRLARMVPDIQLCIVPCRENGFYASRIRLARPRFTWRDTFRCLGMVALCTLIGAMMAAMGLEMTTIGQVYILGVLATGVVTTGWVYGLMGTLLSALIFTLFYVPPIFSVR